MSVNGVNSNLGAYYPKSLEDKRKRAMGLAIPGSLLTISGCALHFAKAPFAVKNPKLLFGWTVLGFLGSFFGFSQAAKAQSELNKFNAQLDKKV